MENFRTPQLQLIHSNLELAKNISKHQDFVLKEFNISHEQFNILLILKYDSCNSSLSLLEIQERMVFSTTNTSRLVNKLKEKKLLTRKANQQNRRKVKIQITKKGEKVIGEARKKMRFYRKKLNDILTEKEAIDINRKINEINNLILDWY